MPPRDPELPEGTDHIVNGASGSSGAAGGAANGGRTPQTLNANSGAEGGGFVATGDGGKSGGGATDKLVNQVRDQVGSLRGQATDKLRGLADDGKGRATNLLDGFSEVINDAARSIDERLGDEYGRYAHQAADAVSSFAGRIRDKSVDDLLDDGRSAVRASPGIAIAAAAVAGFALMRVIRTGLDEVRSGEQSGGGRGRRNADTTAGGGV